MFLRRRIPEKGPLKVAVVGAGAFGRHHCTKYRHIPGVELYAIADSSAETRRAMVAQHGVLAVVDWRELLGKVDLVSICSPAATHAPIVRAFLSAGAHVLVEKPIATTVDEADELVALAKKTGLILTVGHQERFVFSRTGLLDQKVKPLSIECWRRGPWTGRGDDVSAVLDLMIHDLDLLHTMVKSPIKHVSAQGRLDTSRIAETRKRGFRATYADGVVEIDFLTRQVTNTTPRPLQPLEMGDPLGESVAAFVAAVQGGAEPLVQPEQAAQALETALLIEEAAEASMPAAVRAAYARRAAMA